MTDATQTGAALAALKQLDTPSYLSCLFVPEEKREAFAALNAYAAELARIPALVSEPLPGEIRLQWWREIVSGARAGEAANHPLAAGLLSAIVAHKLPLAPLEAMAEARIFDLYHDPMPDLAALETYFGEIEATRLQLGNLILDPENAAKAAEAAGFAGMAIGIANLLRQLRVNTAQRQILIPADMLAALGTTNEAIFDGDEVARAKTVAAIVALGRDHLKSFMRLTKKISPQLRPAFLAVAMCEPMFRKAEKAGAGAFTTTVSLPPILTPIRYAYRAMRGW